MATDNKEKLLNELKSKVKIRNQMSGALYYNMLNDECCQLANKCLSLGCNREQVSEILGHGTFC